MITGEIHYDILKALLGITFTHKHSKLYHSCNNFDVVIYKNRDQNILVATITYNHIGISETYSITGYELKDFKSQSLEETILNRLVYLK